MIFVLQVGLEIIIVIPDHHILKASYRRHAFYILFFVLIHEEIPAHPFQRRIFAAEILVRYYVLVYIYCLFQQIGVGLIQKFQDQPGRLLTAFSDVERIEAPYMDQGLPVHDSQYRGVLCSHLRLFDLFKPVG